MKKECIVEITLKCGQHNRYIFEKCDNDFFKRNKYIYGKNLYNGNKVRITTDEIAMIEIIKE